MTTSWRQVVRVAVVVFGLLCAGALGYVAQILSGSDGTSEALEQPLTTSPALGGTDVTGPAPLEQPPNLSFALGGTDVIVLGSSVEAAGEWDNNGTLSLQWDVVVEAQLMRAEVLQSAAIYGRGWEEDMPPLEAGTTVTILEGIGVAGWYRESALAELGPDCRFVIGLTYWSPEVFPDKPSPWTLSFAAEVRGSSLRFVGANADRRTADLAAVKEQGQAYASMSDQALVVAWAEEIAGNRPRGETGPIQAAYEATITSPPSALERWEALPADHRMLDPEDTPPEVFATLREVPVFVIVDPEAQRDDRYLRILTETGVAHVALLSAGTHPAATFTLPGDAWEIWIADNAAGEGAWQIATVSPDVISTSDGVEIRISGAMVEAGVQVNEPTGDPLDVARGVSSEELQDTIQSWVQAETSGT